MLERAAGGEGPRLRTPKFPYAMASLAFRSPSAWLPSLCNLPPLPLLHRLPDHLAPRVQTHPEVAPRHL